MAANSTIYIFWHFVSIMVNIYKDYGKELIMEKLDIPSLSGKKILITGGCGFLGSTLAKRLVAIGGSVTLFIKPGKDLSNVKEIKKKISIIEGNLLDENSVARAVEGK